LHIDPVAVFTRFAAYLDPLYMHDFDYEDTSDSKLGHFGRVFCALSIVAVSGAIVHNALFAQQSRVFSDTRISVNTDANRLDKLFSALKLNEGPAPVGHTRVKVTPQQPTAELPQPIDDSPLHQTQDALRALGVYDGEVDGIMGTATRSAIVKYQRDNGLTLTGQADPQLLNHLAFMRQIHDASTITGSIEDDAASADIERVQRSLHRLGYDPGPVDGRMGAKTTEALRLFQADRQLPVDGLITPDILALIAKSE
jgi:hypothetical protein